MADESDQTTGQEAQASQVEDSSTEKKTKTKKKKAKKKKTRKKKAKLLTVKDTYTKKKKSAKAEETPREKLNLTEKGEKLLESPVEEHYDTIMSFPESMKESFQKYNMRESYEFNDRIYHPKFGAGFVFDASGTDRIKVLFADGEKVLIQNYSG